MFWPFEGSWVRLPEAFRGAVLHSLHPLPPHLEETSYTTSILVIFVKYRIRTKDKTLKKLNVLTNGTVVGAGVVTTTWMDWISLICDLV